MRLEMTKEDDTQRRGGTSQEDGTERKDGSHLKKMARNTKMARNEKQFRRLGKNLHHLDFFEERRGNCKFESKILNIKKERIKKIKNDNSIIVAPCNGWWVGA